MSAPLGEVGEAVAVTLSMKRVTPACQSFEQAAALFEEYRSHYGADDPYRQRKLGDRPPFLLDDDAADVALVEERLDGVDELFGGDLERFLERGVIHILLYVRDALRDQSCVHNRSSSARDRLASPRPSTAGLQPKLNRICRGASKNFPGTTSVEALLTR